MVAKNPANRSEPAPAAYDLKSVFRAMNICETVGRRLVRDGVIPTIDFGGQKRVPAGFVDSIRSAMPQN